MSTTPQVPTAPADPNSLTPEQIAQQIADQAAPASNPPASQEPAQLQREFVKQLETGQLYKGKTQAELVDQLAKAQEEASKEIKRLREAQKAAQVQPAPSTEPKFDNNKYYELLATDPIQANDYYLDFSPKAQKLNQQMEQFEEMRKDVSHRAEFGRFQSVAGDFDFDNPEAVAKFDENWKNLGLPFTAENLLMAHNHFVRSGIYSAKQEAAGTPITQNAANPTLNGGNTQASPAGMTPQKILEMEPDKLRAYIESLQG